MSNVGLETLKKLVESYNPDALPKLIKAYEYADVMHSGQKRASGEPYIIHPIAVAINAAEYHADVDTLCAALLHDCLEDTKATKEEIENLFGHQVAALVEGVTNLPKTPNYDKKSLDNANIQKVILNSSKDIRVILLKIFDRLHNIRTLNYKDEASRKAKSIETMEIYVPLAKILGLYNIATEFEDYCFSYMRPDQYKRISDTRAQLISDFDVHKDEVIETLIKELTYHSIPSTIIYRVKGIYSIYQSLAQQISFGSINDLLVFRVILDELSDCYRSLQYIHNLYLPISGGMEDLISNPFGVYHAFHTTVMGPDNNRMQIQLQTPDMAILAEYGVTALWHEGIYNSDALLRPFETFFSSIDEALNQAQMDANDFVNLLKGNILSEKIIVFNEHGKSIEIPSGATALDFAYYNNPTTAPHALGAVVSGELVNLGTVLKPNDSIRIISDDKVLGAEEYQLALVRTRIGIQGVKEGMKKRES